jgi:hypothetical protein
VVKQGGRLSLQIHQHRIRGRDDDQILGAGQRDELLLGGDVRAAWVDEDGGTMRGIPGRFLRRQFPNRLSMRRTRRHRRINRPVAKASVHGIYFTVRVGIAPIEKHLTSGLTSPSLSQTGSNTVTLFRAVQARRADHSGMAFAQTWNFTSLARGRVSES